MRDGVSTLPSHEGKQTVQTRDPPDCYFDSGSNAVFTLIWPVETVILRSQGLKPLFFKEIWC